MQLRAYLKPPSDIECPHYKKPMSECCPTCVKWYKLDGSDASTGEKIDGYQCSDVGMFMSMLQLTQKVNELGAAQETTRNEVVKRLNMGLAMNHKPPRMLSFLKG